MWWDEFTQAQFVWLSYNQSRRVAWYPQLRAYFKANFVPVYKHGWHDTLWARKGTPHRLTRTDRRRGAQRC